MDNKRILKKYQHQTEDIAYYTHKYCGKCDSIKSVDQFRIYVIKHAHDSKTVYFSNCRNCEKLKSRAVRKKIRCKFCGNLIYNIGDIYCNLKCRTDAGMQKHHESSCGGFMNSEFNPSTNDDIYSFHVSNGGMFQ